MGNRSDDDELRTCPVCGERVNVYNLHVDPDGEVVGCRVCGKTRRSPAPVSDRKGGIPPR